DLNVEPVDSPLPDSQRTIPIPPQLRPAPRAAASTETAPLAAQSIVDEIVDRAAERTLARMHEVVARVVREEMDRIKPQETMRVEDHEAAESSRHAAPTFLRLILVGVPIVASIMFFETSGQRMALLQHTNPAPVTATPMNGLKVAVAANRVCWISIT